jgi:hypothetical protein
MNIWFEEELFSEASQDSLGTKGTESAGSFSSFVRVYEPREKILNSEEINSIPLAKPNHHYAIVKIGCELDPGNDARAAKAGFTSAKVSVPIWGDGKNPTKVFSLFPIEINRGVPQSVKLKIEPTISVASVLEVGLGSLEADILIGQVAPSIVGFKGDYEMRPYWNLKHKRQAPLYGMRDFWLLLEAPEPSNHCYISCIIVSSLQTPAGLVSLGPKQKNIEHRPRHKIEF